MKPAAHHHAGGIPWGLGGFIPIILLLNVLHLFCAGAAAMGSPESGTPIFIDMATLEYHIESLSNGHFSAPDPEAIRVWKPVTDFDYGELTGKGEIWLKVSVPEAGWVEPVLLLTAFLNGVDVYLGHALIYSYGRTNVPDYLYHMSHRIPLVGYVPGAELYLNIPYPSRAGMGEIISLTVGESLDIHDIMVAERDALYRASIVDVCLGVLLLLIGAGAFFVFIIRIKERDYPFLSFGMFTVFAGMAYLADVNALFFLNLSPETHYYMKSFAFLLVPSGLFAFFSAMFNFTGKASLAINSLWWVHLLMAPVGMVLIAHDIDYMLGFLSILILNCSVCIWIVLKSRHSAPLNIRITFVAFLGLFIVLILLQVMEVLNLITFTYDVFGWGLIVFVFAIGYVLIQHYTSTHHAMQQASLEIERNKSEMLELQKENLASQLEALKSQLDPHFI